MYKMSQVSKEAHKKCEVKIFDKGIYFWVNRRDLEVESDYGNWVQIFDKCDPEKQKYRQELIPNANFNRAECLYEWFSRKKKNILEFKKEN